MSGLILKELLHMNFTSSGSMLPMRMQKNILKYLPVLDSAEIEELTAAHNIKLLIRGFLQKRLAEEMTVMVHSRKDMKMQLKLHRFYLEKEPPKASAKCDERTFLSVFEGVLQFDIEKAAT